MHAKEACLKHGNVVSSHSFNLLQKYQCNQINAYKRNLKQSDDSSILPNIYEENDCIFCSNNITTLTTNTSYVVNGTTNIPRYSRKNFSARFSGPLDDIMLSVVGEKVIPSFEELPSKANKDCVKDFDEDGDPQITNCELELKGLKESLSSYSISMPK